MVEFKIGDPVIILFQQQRGHRGVIVEIDPDQLWLYGVEFTSVERTRTFYEASELRLDCRKSWSMPVEMLGVNLMCDTCQYQLECLAGGLNA